MWKRQAAVLAALLAACGGDDGTPGTPEGGISLERNGVVGVVTDASASRVGGGTVFFVLTGDVAALRATTAEVGSTNDEPLEDVLTANGASDAQAAVDANGVYRLVVLPAGSDCTSEETVTTDSEGVIVAKRPAV